MRLAFRKPSLLDLNLAITVASMTAAVVFAVLLLTRYLGLDAKIAFCWQLFLSIA
ncbi:hypothetical protein [Tateyamaria sp.]|uniref:hypothetical protein n=1 Tax=Tateyamaria sp. TaxID=1929288 RepID=UPI0032885088